ncbi:hypothetical protein AX774_g281 [Zancudomyces culisetae]|uniref:Uncharacterized protein n=1 Tax=Zancudomyces culisetae TaxID=1213189 RepID=A0A1R1PZ03_ZANCU|nr:hypothetical protein AX774_g281 [Zancudomyces culisetae]|eukprot:OMH86167.1 hypothetical protein AX774_g281 [Zancudomyces culisetae]
MEEREAFEMVLLQLSMQSDRIGYPKVQLQFPPPKIELTIQGKDIAKQQKLGKDGYIDLDIKFLKEPKFNCSIQVHELYTGSRIKKTIVEKLKQTQASTGMDVDGKKDDEIFGKDKGIKLILRGKPIMDDKFLYDYILQTTGSESKAPLVVHAMIVANNTPSQTEEMEQDSEGQDQSIRSGHLDQELKSILTSAGGGLVGKKDADVTEQPHEDSKKQATYGGSDKTQMDISENEAVEILKSNNDPSSEFWTDIEAVAKKHFGEGFSSKVKGYMFEKICG